MGKKTKGVDKKSALTTTERLALYEHLSKNWKQWKHQPLKRVFIPKADGTQRGLGIPTISDRAYQCLLKYALEPAAEAIFGARSYGQLALKPEQRVKLVHEMREYTLWQVQPTKRVYIPKSNGKKRPLGIPTIKNRVAQAIVKNALEPSWEARFESNSYGFRPGRSTHDAIEQVFSRLGGRLSK